jgi:predicted nucleotidyltransferase
MPFEVHEDERKVDRARLVGIARKTVGLVAPLREALAPLAQRMVAAFVCGSAAKRRDTSRSDIDLMVVSDKLTYADVSGALESTGARFGRTVNSRKEFARRVKAGNAFVKRVMEQPKVWVIGNEGDRGA